jgi:hypothetical protein
LLGDRIQRASSKLERHRRGASLLIGAIANAGALGGVVSLEGPLNSGNGVVGGIAAPLGLYLAWILSVSVWWLMEGRKRH